MNILNLFFFALLLHSCNKSTDLQSKQELTNLSIEQVRFAKIENQSKDILNTKLAITDQEQTQGLSGIKPEEFGDSDAMLFFNLDETYRNFWMPDTYFNLDIFFLDKELKVLAVERNVKFHPGRDNPELIPRTGKYFCRHVLEMKSSSPISAKILVGEKLNWMSHPSLSQTESSIRHLK